MSEDKPVWPTKRPSVETLRVRFRQAWEATAARVRAPLYLVGSYITDPDNALDIDIVAALGDFDQPRWFDRLRAQMKLSELLTKETGLPIDFKLQNGVQFAGQAAENPSILLAEPGVAIEAWEDETIRQCLITDGDRWWICPSHLRPSCQQAIEDLVSFWQGNDPTGPAPDLPDCMIETDGPHRLTFFHAKVS